MSASESSTLQPNTPVPNQQPIDTSKVPLLGEGFQEATGHPNSISGESSDTEAEVGETRVEGKKSSKRRLFGFGKKKKDDDKTKGKKMDEQTMKESAGNASIPIAQPVAQRVPVS